MAQTSSPYYWRVALEYRATEAMPSQRFCIYTGATQLDVLNWSATKRAASPADMFRRIHLSQRASLSSPWQCIAHTDIDEPAD